jgi:hypothetical protein
MPNTMYIKLNVDGTCRELTEAEFNSDPGNNNATVVRADFNEVRSENPERTRKLDSQTPHVSARRFLQDLFQNIEFDASCKLAVELTKWKNTLFILK